MAPSRDSLADALPSGCVDGSRIPDGDRILPHRYRGLFRRRCTCGLVLCLAAEQERTERRMR